MKSLSIVEWNINQRGGHGNTIPSWLLSELLPAPDILVLTEFNRSASNLQVFLSELIQMGYSYYCSENSAKWGNDVLIAVRGEITIVGCSFVDAYPNNISDLSTPENIRVDIQYEGQNISLMGIRIKELKEDYYSRRLQMQTVMKWVNDISNHILVLGDFNNLRENTPKITWNLRVLDRLLGNTLVRVTPKDNHSWGLSYQCKSGKFDGYIKNDHLLMTSQFTVKQCSYDWSFISKHPRDYIVSDTENKYAQKAITILPGVPDHALLRITLSLRFMVA